MARSAALAVAALLVPGLASASQVSVGVDQDIEVSHYGIQSPNTTDTYFTAEVTAENSGSANCVHSLRADVKAGNKSYTRYSGPAELRSGSAKAQSITLLPTNHTGRVDVNLSATYCDTTTKLAEIRYTQEENLRSRNTIEAATKLSNRSRISFSADKVGNATLVPVDHPPVWKVGRTTLRDGEATARIQPSVYDERKHITYAAVQDGEMTARIQVDLEEDTGMLDEVLAAVTRTEVAAASAALNLALILVSVFAYRQSLKRASAKLR
jgi:hypothetical protein